MKILLAPLDWGLGHATRCIPIIRYLLEKDCDVTIAAEGAAAILLRSNSPELTIIPIEGYKIRYSRYAGAFVFKILMQVPQILKAIHHERKWLAKVQEQYQFDLVISDNRYGLKIGGLPSVIMTHQLQIRSGAGAMIDRLLLHAHYRILEQFDQCWVVDHQGQNGIGGALSHPRRIPSNARYIGPLSQLTRLPFPHQTKKGGVLVLLSGPEPQRTLLEQKILAQISADSPYEYTVVGGNPGGSVPDELPLDIDYHTHLNASQLQDLMLNADLVVCRSGYSTLMDLAAMGKKALLIPTPGQSEQEYLARYLSEQGLFLWRNQSSLQLESDMAKALKLSGFSEAAGAFHHLEMKKAIDAILGVTYRVS
ncbi:MAG: glycosyltransferase [Dyadobacter sp.]|uniref:glycosyltransferase n=1 Tax=Dyadobacter sp. TaxID=1914288 RepID=UPI0032675C8D